MFLLVDLQDFLFRFRVERTKKSSENDLLTGHFQSFLISPEKTVKLPTACIKSLNNSSFSLKSQDRTVTFNSATLKIHRQNLKNIFFSKKQIIFRDGVKLQK